MNPSTLDDASRPARVILAGIAMLALCASGCGAAASVGVGAHHEPAHRPIDLRAAVVRLTELHGEFVGGQKAASPKLDADHPPPSAVEEFRDLVGWIPEFAADSDLNEAQWSKACELGNLLRRTIETMGDSEEAFRTAYPERAPKIQESLTALRTVVQEISSWNS